MRKAVLLVIQLVVIGGLLVPILWMFTNASPQHFFKVFVEDFWFYPKFWFSIFLAAVIGAGAVMVALFAAMGLKAVGERYRNVILVVLVLLMLMPLQTTLLPNYIGLRDLKLLDSAGALILPMLVSPFAIYLMYRYMEAVPCEGLEAARLETDSVLCLLFYVVLPQMKACVAAVFVFMFAEGFNMVEQPLYFVKREELKPLSVLAESLTGENVSVLCVVGLVCMVPMLLLYGFYEEELTDGLTHLKV